MRLNHDCIRDILLFVEENTNSIDDCVSFDFILNSLPYDKDTLSYHIRQMNNAELFDAISCSGGNIELVSNLSWNGHAYIDNIRDITIWNKTKRAASKLTSVSLPVLIEKAADIIINSF